MTARKLTLKVINYQEDADLAVIKITEEVKLPGILEIGDSDSLQVGEQVVAIGNPLGKRIFLVL